MQMAEQSSLKKKPSLEVGGKERSGGRWTEN